MWYGVGMWLFYIFLLILYFWIPLRMLKPLLSFHVKTFDYDAKNLRVVEPTCRCHKNNIMPHSIFNVKIEQSTTCGQICLFFSFLCLFCLLVWVCFCVYLGLIFWAHFIHRDKVLSFLTITLVGFRKT